MTKPVARLTTPAQMVAALPLWLGYVPAESIVVVCCHEPRGRLGLTMRFDLPTAEHEPSLVADIERRVRHQRSTRVVVALYTDEPDGELRVRQAMVDALRARLADLIVTEAVLVREGRFWSYLCDKQACCPAAGTPVEAARESSPVRLLEAEGVLQGRTVLPDREALEDVLAGPAFPASRVALQRCEAARALFEDAVGEAGVDVAAEASLRGWEQAVERFQSPPAELGDLEAAALAVSLRDKWVRDQLAASAGRDLPALVTLLEELLRRTPAPYDAPVCALFAWVSYCQGGGAVVTIALERCLASDPRYTMAHLLLTLLEGQVPPKTVRMLTNKSRGLERWAS